MKSKDLEKETANSDLEATKEEMEEQAQDLAVDGLREQLEKKQAEIDEVNNQYLRMTADFQNYKKRVEKEKIDTYQYANEKLIGDLLPVLDNLERAATSSKEETNKDEVIVKGIEMVLQQFVDILKKNGVEEISSLGVEFDPNLHHAVMQEDSTDYETNHVIAVFQKGYTLNGKVIRPSMVKVAN